MFSLLFRFARFLLSGPSAVKQERDLERSDYSEWAILKQAPEGTSLGKEVVYSFSDGSKSLLKIVCIYYKNVINDILDSDEFINYHIAFSYTPMIVNNNGYLTCQIGLHENGSSELSPNHEFITIKCEAQEGSNHFIISKSMAARKIYKLLLLGEDIDIRIVGNEMELLAKIPFPNDGQFKKLASSEEKRIKPKKKIAVKKKLQKSKK